jgi:hypothetical protein
MVGLQERQADDVGAGGAGQGLGSARPVAGLCVWPAWLAITMPGAAGCDHATQGFEDMRGADQVDGEDRLREACVGDSPAVWITCTTGPQLGGGAGGEGVDGGVVGDVDVGRLGGEARGLLHRNGEVESKDSTLCGGLAIPPLLVEMAGRCPASSGSPAPAMTVACREVRRPRGHLGHR